MPKRATTGTEKASLTLARKALAVVEPREALENMTATERLEYCAAIAGIWPRIEKDIRSLLHEQLIKTTLQSATWEEVLVGRGVFAGMELLFEHWQKAVAEHQDNVSETNEEPHDPNSVVGDV